MAVMGKTSQKQYWQYALWLALFTIFYNLAEGLISIYFGVEDEALTLFGFGIDSFIEVMSGIGILAMVLRIRQNTDAPRSPIRTNCSTHYRHLLLPARGGSCCDSHL